MRNYSSCIHGNCVCNYSGCITQRNVPRDWVIKHYVHSHRAKRKANSKHYFDICRFLLTAGEGNVFTRVCYSFHWGVGGLPTRGSLSRVSLSRRSLSRGPLSRGVSVKGGAWIKTSLAATAAVGTHPTGMYSCYLMFLL